jgi:AbrB family looped-hinge helix DNA binding protein
VKHIKAMTRSAKNALSVEGMRRAGKETSFGSRLASTACGVPAMPQEGLFLFLANGIFTSMISTIDSAGRLVIPKAVREQAGLRSDVPVEITYRDGHVEIAPAPRRVAIVKKGRVAFARPEQGTEALTRSVVESARKKLRER